MLKRYGQCIVIIALFFLGCSGSNESLIGNLSNPNAKVRNGAVRRLMLHGHDTATIKKLIALLESEDEQLVFITVQILSSPIDSIAVHEIGRLTKHRNPDIRFRAVESLGLIGHKSALPYLFHALEDSVVNVRRMAVMKLGLFGEPSAIEPLCSMFGDTSARVKSETVQALIWLRNNVEIYADLFTMPMNDDNELVRYVAVQALGNEYPDEDVAVELLMKALDDPSSHVCAEAVKSISRIGYKKAIPQLKKMHNTSQYEVQIAISGAIRNMTGETYPDFTKIVEKLE